jgi:hypothetical protein
MNLTDRNEIKTGNVITVRGNEAEIAARQPLFQSLPQPFAIRFDLLDFRLSLGGQKPEGKTF